VTYTKQQKLISGSFSAKFPVSDIKCRKRVCNSKCATDARTDRQDRRRVVLDATCGAGHNMSDIGIRLLHTSTVKLTLIQNLTLLICVSFCDSVTGVVQRSLFLLC